MRFKPNLWALDLIGCETHRQSFRNLFCPRLRHLAVNLIERHRSIRIVLSDSNDKFNGDCRT